MKELTTYISENFKISHKTQLGKFVKVLIIQTWQTKICPFTIAENQYSILYVLDDEYLYHYMGREDKPWQSPEQISKDVGVDLTHGKYKYLGQFGLNRSVTMEVYAGIKIEKDILLNIENQQENNILSIPVKTDKYKGKHPIRNYTVNEFLDKMINDGYLERE
jgi:hypothetical protein